MEEEILARNSGLPDVKNTKSVYKIWRQLLITSSTTCEGKGWDGVAGTSSDCFKALRLGCTGETKSEEDVTTAALQQNSTELIPS
jgi:hypothetical protein